MREKDPQDRYAAAEFLAAVGLRIVELSIVLVGVLLASCSCTLALNPSLDVSQYAHTAWKVRDGFFKGAILSVAQTPDGYIWLGTEVGLLRFDGVKAVPWEPSADQHLPSNQIWSLLAARDGTLWIGTSKGLASWKDGKIARYAELSGQIVYRLLEDRAGSVWAGTAAIPASRLCAVHNGSAQCYGEHGIFGDAIYGLYEDRNGNLWAGVKNGLWRWKPGPPQFYPLAADGIRGLAEDGDGTLLISTPGGIRRFADGKFVAYPLPSAVGKFGSETFHRDHEGGLWIGTGSQGIVHIHRGRTDVYTASDGLSGDRVAALFEDREGNIWAGTIGGLDRFRDFAVATFSRNQGTSSNDIGTVLVDRGDGSVWLGDLGGLKRWINGQIMIPRTGSDKPGAKLNGQAPNPLFQDSSGRIWVSTLQGLGYLQNDRFVSISAVPGGRVPSIAEDSAENLWIANQDHGLFQLRDVIVVRQIPWAKLGHKDTAMVLAADPLRRGLWLGFFAGGVVYFKDGQVRASYAAADGLAEGRVTGLRLEPDGTLWVSTEGGLSRLKNGSIATLTSKNGLPCDGVDWTAEDDNHFVWIYTACGLVRVARPELDVWAAAIDKNKDAKPMIQKTVFDSSDGVGNRGLFGFYSPRVAKSPDGELFFRPWEGVGVIDPRHLPFNKIPPLVHIEQITADRKAYDPVSYVSYANGNVPLPARVRDLEIDYTALSFVAPEKVRFRYKLEGRDRDWQDAGNRRQAFYSDLPPRNYRFRVMACNNSGVWNEEGAFLDFSVAPAYYQTTWFRLSGVAAFLALLAGLYQLRLRQLAQRFNMTLEARVGERTRIARDLHDTLLQTFQGLLLQFRALSYQLPDRSEFRKKLENLIDKARAAITEGRDAVQGLRASTVVGNDLAQSINALGEELAADPTVPHAPDFQVLVEGTPRNLVPILRDEVYQIAGEAMRNAFRHAHAKRIEVEIEYGERQLYLRVRDDGKGIDPKTEQEGGRAGHYGIPGMRERAKLIGADLDVWSEIQSGTEIELAVPGRIAYAKQPAARRSGFSHKEV